jgi:galactose mutarotase-like enzyme
VISECLFKGCKAIKLENDKLIVILLPHIGGKIVSLYNKAKQFELLFQNRDDVYKKAKTYDDFSKFDASGFDDAFPTIDACEVEYGGRKIKYPDHGEIWSSSFRYKIDGDKVCLYYESELFSYLYQKVLYLKDNRLCMEYNIKNKSSYDFPCIWAMHCLVVCDEKMTIDFPEGTDIVENVLESEDLGEVGRLHPYPITKTRNGRDYPLNRILGKSANKAKKYYAAGKVSKGECGNYYPEKDVNYVIYFDKEKLPYLGFWVTEGGFRGDYNCALEPTNGYYDSINNALEKDGLYILKAKDTLSFDIKIELV